MRKYQVVLAIMVFASGSSLSVAGIQYNSSALPDATGATFNDVLAVSPDGAVGASFIGDWNQLDGVFQPTVWQGSQAALLPIPAGYQGNALGISGLGDVAGFVWTNDANATQPALWQNGQLQMLGTLTMPSGSAYAVNNEGNVVGSINDYESPASQSEAVLWSAGQVTVLGNFINAQAWAPAINNQGQILVVAGYADHTETWIWSNGTLSQVPSLGGRVLGGSSINDAGTVVGGATSAENTTVAFASVNGITTQLPNLPGDAASIASDINDNNQIVGFGIDALNDSHAVLWEDGQVFNLNDLIASDSGWMLDQALSISDDGEIVGNGYFDGQPSAFLLTPTGDGSFGASTVPEPATLALLTLSTLPLLLLRRRKAASRN